MLQPSSAHTERGALPAELRGLRESLDGKVVVPGSAAYASARRVFNRSIDRFPKIIVYAAREEEVQRTIGFARELGLRLSIRSGGCSVAGFSVNDGGVLLDVSRLRKISVDADDTVTIGAGARLGEVYPALLGRGVVIPGGECPIVGIAGLTLGGGISLLGRRLGITADQLVRARVVLADGRRVTVGEGRHEDLDWGLRGGGAGNFGVVTSLTFRTSTMPEKVYAGIVSWPIERAAEALAATLETFEDGLPDEVGAIFMLLDVKGSKELWMVPVYYGAPAKGSAALGPLITEGADARLGEWDYAKYLREHFYGGSAGLYAYWKSGFIDGPPPAKILDLVVDAFKEAPSDEALIAFEMCGGAMNRVKPSDTAFPHRDHLALMSILANSDRQDQVAASERWADDLYEALVDADVIAGHHYYNYPDVQLPDWQRCYWRDNYPRLQRVKSRYDPDDFFTFSQSVQPVES